MLIINILFLIITDCMIVKIRYDTIYNTLFILINWDSLGSHLSRLMFIMFRDYNAIWIARIRLITVSNILKIIVVINYLLFTLKSNSNKKKNKCCINGRHCCRFVFLSVCIVDSIESFRLWSEILKEVKFTLSSVYSCQRQDLNVTQPR